MIGLLIKDFYSLRQYTRTLVLMLMLFALISTLLDNPAIFLEGFVIYMSMMMTLTSFSYDALAKWDRFALSMPVTRKEVVAGKYLLSIILILAGAVSSFLVASAVLAFRPMEGFGMTEHLYSIMAIICTALFFSGILLPVTFQFGVEKSRLIIVVVFAIPMAVVIALGKMGFTLPSGDTLLLVLRLLPILIILYYLLSFVLSVRIYKSKEV